ncbi:MAG: YIP1 family protein [Candidatus Acidiferrales bacterium]
MADAPTPAPAPVSTDNSFSRMFGVIFSPKPTFESIAKRPTWALPLIIFVFVGFAATTVITQRVGWRAVIDREIASSPKAQQRLEQLPPEKRDQALNGQAKITPYIVYAINVLFPFVGAVIVAAVLLLAFNVIGGARINFKTSLAVVAYSWIPLLIAGLLGILILFLKDPSTVDVKNLVASNPGALLPDDSSKALVSLLSSLDLFSFWTMILMAVGYCAADPKKISFAKALGMVVAVWLLFVMVKVGWVAAFP